MAISEGTAVVTNDGRNGVVASLSVERTGKPGRPRTLYNVNVNGTIATYSLKDLRIS